MLQITLENREVGETRALVILSVSVSQRGDKDSSGRVDEKEAFRRLDLEFSVQAGDRYPTKQ